MKKRIDELIDTYINTVSSIIPGNTFDIDENLFERMINFIIELDPDSLSDEQLDEANSIIEDLETAGKEEVSEVKFATRSSVDKRRKSKSYYRKNKSKIKRKKKVFNKSALGRKRKKLKIRMAKQNKSATGRRKVRHRMT